MLTADHLAALPRGALMALIRQGHPIDPEALDDTEYRGVSLGLPALVDKLAWKTFRKVFHRDPDTGHLRGWNVRLVQDGGDAPMRKRGRALTFGHYRVVSPEGHRAPEPLPGLLIHYGLGGNAALDPVGRLRDPIVALEPGRTDLLLGWTYVDLGVGCVGTPSFFTLERTGPLTEVITSPTRRSGAAGSR